VEAVEELLVKAPKLLTPVPVKERASVAELVSEYPLRSREAPLLTVVPAAVVPKGPLALEVEEAPSFTVPALIVNDVVKVLAPERVSVPLPALLKVFVPTSLHDMVASPKTVMVPLAFGVNVYEEPAITDPLFKVMVPL